MDFMMSTDLPAMDTVVSFGTAVDECGLESPSLRAVARAANCSASTLLAWFGCKAELHRRTLAAFGVRWRQTLTHGLIPSAPADLFYARLRLAFDELVRSDPLLAEVVDELILVERRLIGESLVRSYDLSLEQIDPQTITILHALLLALWDERAYPNSEESWGLLRRAARALVRPQDASLAS
jgi:AcrR family transcriptional regulator